MLLKNFSSHILPVERREFHSFNQRREPTGQPGHITLIETKGSINIRALSPWPAAIDLFHRLFLTSPTC